MKQQLTALALLLSLPFTAAAQQSCEDYAAGWLRPGDIAAVAQAMHECLREKAAAEAAAKTAVVQQAEIRQARIEECVSGFLRPDQSTRDYCALNYGGLQ